MRGVRPLDREQNSSHVLEVEAYNTEQGPMRSSVRVRTPQPLRAARLRRRFGVLGPSQCLQLYRKLERSGMKMLVESL